MHFDLQDTKDFKFRNYFKTGEVVKYERIKCPNPYKPKPYPESNKLCKPENCKSGTYPTNDSCLKAMGGVSTTGKGTCCILGGYTKKNECKCYGYNSPVTYKCKSSF